MNRLKPVELATTPVPQSFKPYPGHVDGQSKNGAVLVSLRDGKHKATVWLMPSERAHIQVVAGTVYAHPSICARFDLAIKHARMNREDERALG